MKTVNGVAIPGQWLTPKYVKQKRAEHTIIWTRNHGHGFQRVEWQTCNQCGATYRTRHMCPLKHPRFLRQQALKKRLRIIREEATHIIGVEAAKQRIGAAHVSA